MDTRKMTDTAMLNTIEIAYAAGYRLHRSYFDAEGSRWYWTSNGREIIGTRKVTLRECMKAGAAVLGEPLAFVKCATVGCENPATVRLTWGPDDERITEYVCTSCAETYSGMPSKRARVQVRD